MGTVVEIKPRTIVAVNADNLSDDCCICGLTGEITDDAINDDLPIIVTCRKHGPFWVIPSEHLAGVGCPVCDHAH